MKLFIYFEICFNHYKLEIIYKTQILNYIDIKK